MGRSFIPYIAKPAPQVSSPQSSGGGVHRLGPHFRKPKSLISFHGLYITPKSSMRVPYFSETLNSIYPLIFENPKTCVSLHDPSITLMSPLKVPKIYAGSRCPCFAEHHVGCPGLQGIDFTGVIPSPNIQPPSPPQCKVFPIVVHYTILGVFSIRGWGRLYEKEEGISVDNKFHFLLPLILVHLSGVSQKVRPFF